MKHMLFAFIVLLSLVGCTHVTEVISPPIEVIYPDPPIKKWVYDSYWKLIYQTPDTLAKAIVIESGDIAAQVEAYKASHLTSSVFIMDEETPIESAPNATVWIVGTVSHDPIKAFLDVPRADFVDRASAWDLEARADGGTLYVDIVPPPPLPVDTTYKYYLYLIAEDGSILFSTQCAPEIFDMTYRSYVTESYLHPGSRVVHGELYQG